jgi:hypothetical protein
VSDEPLTIPKVLLQNVFDIAVGSMDFGSGMLDNEEVDQLRAIAVVLGLDPNVGTPASHKCHYGDNPHHWTPWKSPTGRGEVAERYCYNCKKHEQIARSELPP